MNEFTSLKITKPVHAEILKYCKDNGLLVYRWAEKVLLEKIREERELKENANLQNNKSN